MWMPTLRLLTLPLLFFSLLTSPCAHAWPWNPKVKTAQGIVEGFESDGVMVFHSIPFAKPPQGVLRFKPPVYPADSWEGVRNAKGQPSMCPQIKVTSLFHMGREDCLDVHVYVPRRQNHSGTSALPVMYWIFGGGYVLGDGYEFSFYNAKKLSKATNTIVVAVNYRVGPLGFLSHDALQREDSDASTGNMGVRDQQAGLLWVRDNIAAFGGDPSRVSIFGESAGGFSVCWHLASPKSRGLFHAAIIESGSCDADEFFLPLRSQNDFGDAYSAAIGCNSSATRTDAEFLACLRSKKTEEIMNGILNWFNPNWPHRLGNKNGDGVARGPSLAAFERVASSKPYSELASLMPGTQAADILAGLPPLAPVMPWGPTVDGSTAGLLDKPLNILRSGKGNYVPTIWGSNKDEGSMFVPLVSLVVKGGSFPLTESSLEKTLLHFYKNNATMVNEVLTLYPLGDYSNNQDDRAAAILRDCFFTCAMRRAARAMDDHGAKSWLYHFEFPLKGLGKLAWNILGNFHASELGFVFNTWVSGDKESQTMVAAFQRYWGNLAHSLDVNVDGNHVRYKAGTQHVVWPHHNRSTDYNIVLDLPVQPQQHLYKDKCDYWDIHA